MIYESYIWRDGLRAAADRLERLQTQKKIFNHSLAICERELMIGFFSIRKLVEARSKVSDKCSKLPIKLQKYPATRPFGNSDRWSFWECFDLGSPEDLEQPLEFVANQIIHSYLFNFEFDKRSRPSGIFFVSAKKSGEGCFSMSLKETTRAFRYVANSEPDQLILTVNKGGGRDLIASGSRKH